MTPYSQNPFIYLFSGIVILAVLLYLTFTAINKMGLKVESAIATVTDMQYTAGGKTYYTNIVNGRPYVQSQVTPETYALTLNIDEEKTVGLVSKQLFESLNTNDQVYVKVRRTRITKRLEVVEVTR